MATRHRRPVPPYGFPGQVAIDSAGNVYIADTLNNRIQEIAATDRTQFGIPMTAGYDYTIAGLANGVGGDSADPARRRQPRWTSRMEWRSRRRGRPFHRRHGKLRVREVPAISGTYFGRAMTDGDIYTIAGVNGTCGSTGNGGIGTSAELYDPKGITLDAAGDVVVADYYSNEVHVVAASPHTQWGVTMNNTGYIYDVVGTGTAGTGGNWVLDTSAELYEPAGVAIDSSGNLYVADSGNNRVQELYGSSDEVATVAGNQGGAAGNVYGTESSPMVAWQGKLDDPQAVVVDSSGDLYIADTGNNHIEEVPSSTGIQWYDLTADSPMDAGDIYVVAGAANATPGFAGDGYIARAVGAELDAPDGLAIDHLGNVYIADSVNNRLREVAAGADPVFGTSPAMTGITYNTGNGAQDTYFPSGTPCPSGVGYVPNGSAFCALSRTCSGRSPRTRTGPARYPDPCEETYTFNSPGAGPNAGGLLSEQDVAGNTETVSYGTPSPGSGYCPSTPATGCNTVTSASGRSLVMGLSGTGSATRITSVTDPMGRTWNYAYSSTGDLVTAETLSATRPPTAMTRATPTKYWKTTSSRSPRRSTPRRFRPSADRDVLLGWCSPRRCLGELF